MLLPPSTLRRVLDGAPRVFGFATYAAAGEAILTSVGSTVNLADRTAPPTLSLERYKALCAGKCWVVANTTPPEERVRELNDLSRKASMMPPVREQARMLFRQLTERLRRVPTAAELIQWLMDRVHDFVDYLPDPPGIEMFMAPYDILTNRMGRTRSPYTGDVKGGDDCEGLASIVVAWGMALGLNMGSKWWSQPGAALNHVSAEACNSTGEWRGREDWRGCVAVETTIPGAIFGETPYEAIKRIGPAYRARVFGS